MKDMIKIKNFIVKYKISFIGTILLTFIIYGIRLFHYHISIDTEVLINSFNGQIASWNSIHRYTLGIIKYLFHLYPFNYYLSNFLMISFFILSIYFLYYIIDSTFLKKRASNTKILLFNLLIISSPIFAEQFSFTLQCAEVAISLFIFDIGLFFFLKSFQRSWYLVLSIICFIMSLGCYQSFMTLLISMLILLLFIKNQEETNKKDNIHYIYKAIIVIVISFIGYLIVGNSINSFLHITPTSYLKEQIGWFNHSIPYCLIKIFGFIGKVLIGYGIFYNISYFICVLLVIKYILNHKKNLWRCILSLIYLISPFFLVLLLGHSEVVRAQLTLPIVIACLFLIVPDLDNNKLKKYLFLIISLIILEQSLTTINLFLSDYHRFTWDKKFADNLMKKENKENKKIVFVGSYGYEKRGILKGETLGSSFFEWDKDSDLGINRRAIGFMNALGYSLEVPTISEYETAKQITNNIKTKNMEIIEEDDLIIIKFPS